MKGIILSAGKGTRVKEVNKELPKLLIPLAGKPMIVWNIELCKKYGIENIAINTHYMADKIKNYLGDGSQFGVKIKYNYEPNLLGTSGALSNFKDFFNESFVVIYGDIISQLNINKIKEFHKKNKSLATLVVHKTNHPEDSDIVQMNENNMITKVIHKPGNTDFGDLGNAAFYIIEPKIFDYLPEGESDFIKDVFPKMISTRESLYGYKTDEFIEDAGTPLRIVEVEEYLKNIK